MYNMSGNYDTEEKEIAIVKFLFDSKGIGYKNVNKHLSRDDADVLVELKNGQFLTIEVKEESINRIKKYNDLGIDFISSCIFKNPTIANDWKGSPKSPERLNEFINLLDTEHSNFKWGKIKYSSADLWLFFAMKNDTEIEFCDIYSGMNIVTDEFYNYLKSNCKFTVNNKSSDQLSAHDNHDSAVFFINRNDKFLNKMKVWLEDYLRGV